MQATKLPLTSWFLAFYLIGQAKTGISSLELSRHLGVKYDTAWLLHNKILRAMTEREEAYVLRGKIQMDDAYLGGERPGGKAGRGSENKIPIVAAVSLNEAGHPIHARITAVSGFSSEAIADWAKGHLMPGSHVLSDGLACFRAVTTANCHHKAVVTGGKRPNVFRSSAGSTPFLARLEAADRAIRSGLGLSIAEVSWILGVKPGSFPVTRGGITAPRSGWNYWRLQSADSADPG